MAAFTDVGKSYIAALGPFKVEVVFLTDPNDNDTFTSKLSNPSFAMGVHTGDATGTTDFSVSLSGKTITLHDPRGSLDAVVLVFGDSITAATR